MMEPIIGKLYNTTCIISLQDIHTKGWVRIKPNNIILLISMIEIKNPHFSYNDKDGVYKLIFLWNNVILQRETYLYAMCEWIEELK